MDEGIKKDMCSVMEDFSKVPGDKDFNKMKSIHVCGCCCLEAGVCQYFHDIRSTSM